MTRSSIGARMASLLVICLAAVSITVSAQPIYEWVDENGNRAFGEQPPPGVDAREVSVEPAPENPSPSPYARPAGTQEEGSEEPVSRVEQQRRERAERARERAADREAIAEACKKARDFLIRVGSRPNVLVQNEDGTVSRVDDETRVREVEKAQAFIDENCD